MIKLIISLFSTRGRIGRASLIRRHLLALLIVILSPFLMFAYGIAAGITIDHLNPIWIVRAILTVVQEIGVWIKPLWVLAFWVLLAARIYACAVVQRARDIGIEIPTVLLVPFYLLYKANMGKLVFDKSIHVEQPHVSKPL